MMYQTLLKYLIITTFLVGEAIGVMGTAQQYINKDNIKNAHASIANGHNLNRGCKTTLDDGLTFKNSGITSGDPYLSNPPYVPIATDESTFHHQGNKSLKNLIISTKTSISLRNRSTNAKGTFCMLSFLPVGSDANPLLQTFRI